MGYEDGRPGCVGTLLMLVIVVLCWIVVVSALLIGVHVLRWIAME